VEAKMHIIFINLSFASELSVHLAFLLTDGQSYAVQSP
jgi:hypothetical protein